MIREQIIARGIHDKGLIKAMRSVDRSLFVPKECKESAFGDFPLHIGFGQTISQPYIVAYMIEQLHLVRGMKVLEIGTGSGYQTAILSRLGCQVFSIESISELARTASKTLRIRGFGNITLKEGDGYAGWPEQAPYKGIIVSAAAPKIPRPLMEQLDNEGRMIIPIGSPYGVQRLIRLTKNENSITRESLIPVRFVPFVSDRFPF